MVTSAKAMLRTRLLASRRAVAAPVRAAEAAALASHLVPLVHRGLTVCAYVPVGSEPGSRTLLNTLGETGARVLLPVALTGDDGEAQPLRWGEYRKDTLVPGPFGLLEPPAPHLGPEALGEAALVLVPALAVDRRGVRLGRGAGFYDRSLPLRDPAALLIAVVRDDEVLDELPAEPHDVRMTHAVTPGAGLIVFSASDGRE
ncbi:5-formyltetrahydrofolate cyclo-ligase [Mycolicibacterium palauense]|uniref:5-formyltetrahydrofolate cyclo-ligase n=1 Tax=Mycolicibacterium palauense TaxID=2034511 RepID=UPI000BFEB6DD|nr:5-formyltetrahydrofolate cyclo-ligase [Mycolicibacterium palauense]